LPSLVGLPTSTLLSARNAPVIQYETGTVVGDEEVSEIRRRWILGALILTIPVIVFLIANGATAIEYGLIAG
jgi:hypothetical protein